MEWSSLSKVPLSPTVEDAIRLSLQRAELLITAEAEMHVRRAPFPISERLAKLSNQIVFRPEGQPPTPWVPALGIRPIYWIHRAYNVIEEHRWAAPELEPGLQLIKLRMLGKKRRGKRFQDVLAEIVSQKLGGPPHRASDFFHRQNF